MERCVDSLMMLLVSSCFAIVLLCLLWKRLKNLFSLLSSYQWMYKNYNLAEIQLSEQTALQEYEELNLTFRKERSQNKTCSIKNSELVLDTQKDEQVTLMRLSLRVKASRHLWEHLILRSRVRKQYLRRLFEM